MKTGLLLHRCEAATCIPVPRKAGRSIQRHLFYFSRVSFTSKLQQVMYLSTFVLSTTMRCNNYSRWELISFSSLYPSCLPLLAEGFDRYLPSSGFSFSVWEWFLQHTASLIYLKMQKEINACLLLHHFQSQKLQPHFILRLNQIESLGVLLPSPE